MKRRGNAIVEFVLMLPVILIIISGSIDYGFYFHRQSGLTQATYATARYASLHPDDINGAITLGENSFLAATGDAGNFYVEVSGVRPDIHVTVISNALFNPIVGLIPTPAEHNHTAFIRVGNQ